MMILVSNILKRSTLFLLCDLYEWAGQARTVDISKKRTKLLDAASIESVGTKCFAKVKEGYFENLPFDEFVKRIAEFYNDVNYIHPIREGNGRTQRTISRSYLGITVMTLTLPMWMPTSL